MRQTSWKYVEMGPLHPHGELQDLGLLAKTAPTPTNCANLIPACSVLQKDHLKDVLCKRHTWQNTDIVQTVRHLWTAVNEKISPSTGEVTASQTTLALALR